MPGARVDGAGNVIALRRASSRERSADGAAAKSAIVPRTAHDRRVGGCPSPYLAHAKVSVPPYLIAKWKESGCPDSSVLKMRSESLSSTEPFAHRNCRSAGCIAGRTKQWPPSTTRRRCSVRGRRPPPGQAQTWQARISLSSSCSFSIVLSCPAEMTRQDQYCNAQSFERSVKTAPIKCRKISMIKTTLGFTPVRLHRTIARRALGDANRVSDRARALSGRVGASSRRAGGSRCWLRSQSQRTRIAPRRRALVNQIEATTRLEDIRGQGRDRLAGARGQIQDRKGFALSALRTRRGARHHQRAIRAKPAHRRIEAVGAQGRQGRVHQPRGLAHLQRLLRLRDRAGTQARAAASSVRRDDPDP